MYPSTSSSLNSSKYTPEQLVALEACYEKNPTPSSQAVKDLAQETGLTQAQCRAWLQYQRKKRRKHLMEHEREVFRIEIKCLHERIGSVKEQNHRLHAENERLRKAYDSIKQYEKELDKATSTLIAQKKTEWTEDTGGGGIIAIEEQKQQKDEEERKHSQTAKAQVEDKDKMVTEEEEEGDTTQRQRQSLDRAAMTLAGVLTKRVEEISEKRHFASISPTPPITTTKDSAKDFDHASHAPSSRTIHAALTASSSATTQQELLRKLSQRSEKSKEVIRGEEQHIIESLCNKVADQLKNASCIITSALDKSGEVRQQRRQVALHHPDTLNIRHVLQQKESALSDEILRSMDAIVKSQSSDESKEKSVAPLLQSYLRTEISIKEQQLLLKSRMLAHLPLVPHQSGLDGTDPCAVKCTSMFCILSQHYLGLAERSLCLLGEASLSALLTQAIDYLLHSRKCISEDDYKVAQSVLQQIKAGEIELLRHFHEKWEPIQFTTIGAHHKSAEASALFSTCFRMCLLESSGQVRQTTGQEGQAAMICNLLTYSTQTHINGLKSVHQSLHPVLCSKLFVAMKEVKQLLVTADSFNEQVHNVKKPWEYSSAAASK
jgi:hypothetical protein